MEFNLILIVIWGVSIYLLLHTYVIYPISVLFISWFYKKYPRKDENEFPLISILISAFNEEKVIRKRVENISRLKYDFDKLEVIIGSDCSGDNTDEILKDLCSKYPWLKVKFFKKRRGKASVLNDLVKEAQNSVLVFTDANTVFNQDSITKLVSYYIDDRIGGVCGRLILEEPQNGFNKSNKEKAYWKYETFLKRYEGKIGLLMGANGGIFSIRKELYNEIPIDKPVTDDLFITLNVIKKGYKFLYAYDAVAVEEVSKKILSEFKRKVRFAATNFQTLLFFKNFLFNKNLLLSYTFWSHKVLRWFMPFALIIIFILNILFLGYADIYMKLFYVQLTIHILSIVGYFLSLLKIKLPFITLIFFFNLTNLALFIGFVRFLKKKHTYIWESTPR